MSFFILKILQLHKFREEVGLGVIHKYFKTNLMERGEGAREVGFNPNIFIVIIELYLKGNANLIHLIISLTILSKKCAKTMNTQNIEFLSQNVVGL